MEKIKNKDPYEYRHIHFVNKSFFISHSTYTHTPISNIHFHNGYEIILITQGKYKIYAPQKIYEGNGPCLGIFQTGTYHGCIFFECEKETATRFVINYTSDLIDRIPSYMLDAKEFFENDISVLPLDDSSLEILLFYFGELYKIYKENFASNKSDIISPTIYTYMAVLFNSISELIRRSSVIVVNMCKDGDNYVYEILRELLKATELNRSISSADIAKKYFVSHTKLSEDFVRVTGMGVKQMIDMICFERAKKMLGVGMSNKDIAKQLGFSSESYFIQFFKKHMNISPGEYRKLNNTKKQ